VKHEHFAVGLVPGELVNLAVKIAWTPGSADYSLILCNAAGEPMEPHRYDCTAQEPLGYTPESGDFDMCVYWGLAHVPPLPGQLARSLAGFAFFKWFSPAAMPSKDRGKWEAVK
jgi:hypothetical protein